MGIFAHAGGPGANGYGRGGARSSITRVSFQILHRGVSKLEYRGEGGLLGGGVNEKARPLHSPVLQPGN